MKKILVNKNIIYLSINILFLFFLINSSTLFSQNFFANHKNYYTLFCETTLNNNFKIDGIKIDKLNIEVSDKKIEEDTNVTNKITRAWFINNSNELKIKVQVIDKNKNITIKVYNMLGKEVMKVFEGTHTNDEYEYTAQWNLPDGIFICVVQGSNFRNAEKIVISRY
jgi:hypothetical protein